MSQYRLMQEVWVLYTLVAILGELMGCDREREDF